MDAPSKSAAQHEPTGARVAGDPTATATLPSDLDEHEQRHRRRSSGAESTLAPLPVFLPAKVLPRGDSLSFSSPVSGSASNVFRDSAAASPSAGHVIEDASNMQMDLQTQTANYETILRHFNLRKLHLEQAKASPASAVVDYSLHTARWSTASSGSARRHLGSSRVYLPSSRFSLHRSLTNLRRNASGSVVAWLGALRRPMTPTGVPIKLREFVLFWVYCFQLLYLPFAPAYLANTPAHELVMVRINMALELIYLADMLATCNTAVYSPNHGSLQLVTSRYEIATRYFKGDFTLDLLSAVPLETGAWLLSTSQLSARSQQQQPDQSKALLLIQPVLYHVGNVLRVLRLVRNFIRAAQSEWITQLAALYEFQCHLVCGVYCVLVRSLARMCLLSLAMAHYSACLWHAIIICGQANHDDDASSPASLAAVYLGDARHVLLIMVGSGDETGDPFKDAFAIALMLTGVLFFSCVLGNVSLLITTTKYSPRVEFERKKQALVSKMAKLQLPQELQERIYRYYEHLWTEYDATHEEDITNFTKNLTRPLALEVGLCRYMNLVVRVPFWADCSPDFVSAVVLNLRVLVFLPDDYIVRKGEIGTEFFMVYRGVGELTGSHRESVRLTNGASFGEVALLRNCKRATSVRALTYMEICVLPRKRFQKILARYHNDRRRVILRMLRRGLESNEHPQLWQEVLLRKAHRHHTGGRANGDGGETTKRSFSQAAGKLNNQKASAEANGEITVAEGAEILADAMDFMVRETSPTSVSDDLRRWGASDPLAHGSRRSRKQRVHSTSSCSSIDKRQDKGPMAQQEPARSPTTSVAPGPDTKAESLDGEAQLDSRGTPPGSNSNGRQPPNEQLELLRSLMALMARVEEKLSRVETKVAQLETHDPRPQLSHSGSIGKALIAVTVPSYATASEDCDAVPSQQVSAAQYARVCTAAVFDSVAVGLRYEHLGPEHAMRRAFSLDVGMKQNLAHFHQQRSLQATEPNGTSTVGIMESRFASGAGTDDTMQPPGQRHSASFRLQARRKSKSTLTDQLWRKNSFPSHCE